VRVLLLGATTPLGQVVARRLLDDPAVQKVLEAGIEPYVGTGTRDDYHRVDLRRDRAVHDFIHGPAHRAGIDTVIHLALHRNAADEGPRVHERNVEATRRLLRACEETDGIRRFVFVSTTAVYAVRAGGSCLLDEDAALELDPAAPQWIRDRAEADLTVCSHIGTSPLSIAVLRIAEVLAPAMGGQLWDYVQSRVCLRPLGFDPMINVISLEDAALAIVRAAQRDARGMFNIAGADTLPLSRLIARSGRRDIPVPGPLLAPLYRLRASTTGLEFRYDVNLRRFHFGNQVDDARARDLLGYRPAHPIAWPAP
jgi:UDP-glucose 4-epimerase